MKRLLFAVAVSFALAIPVARAQTTTSVTFTAVDAVEAQYGKLVITGVPVGETTAKSVEFPTCSSTDGRCAAVLENCERLALLAMTKPGQYVFKLGFGYSYGYGLCKLERVAP